MDYSLKDYLDLLTPYRSDEAKRARRSVNGASFVVLLVWLLNVPVHDVTVFSLTLPEGSTRPLLWITLALLAYWTVSFWVTTARDRELQRARTQMLEAAIKIYRKQVAAGIIESPDRPGLNIPTPAATVAFVAAYDEHMARTKRAAALGRFINALEWLTPALLSTAALALVAWWLYLGRVCGLHLS